MCGGGGGILGKVFGGVSKFLFGSPSDKGVVFNAPAPAQPAPSRKQDTGATVIVGADSVDDRLSATLKNKKRTSLSSLSSIGGTGGTGGTVSGINI